MASSIEFVRIGGYPVKVTSLARDENAGSITLVVITRGTADRNHLNELLSETPLTLEAPEEPPVQMSVEGIDARSVGEGERVITRFSIRLVRTGAGNDEEAADSARSLEERLGAIERKVDLILDEVRQSRKERHGDPG